MKRILPWLRAVATPMIAWVIEPAVLRVKGVTERGRAVLNISTGLNANAERIAYEQFCADWAAHLKDPNHAVRFPAFHQ